MSERLYYIDDQWVTYEQAHNEYGYTYSRPESVELFNSNCESVIVRKDTDDNTFWDSDNHVWVSDISLLHLYKSVGVTTLYRSSTPIEYDSYSSDYSSLDAGYVRVGDCITPTYELYRTLGYTDHPCIDYYVKDAVPICWYDQITELYWDSQSKSWLREPPDYENGVVLVGQMPLIDRGERFDNIEMYEVNCLVLSDTFTVDNLFDNSVLLFVNDNNAIYTMASLDEEPSETYSYDD